MTSRTVTRPLPQPVTAKQIVQSSLLALGILVMVVLLALSFLFYGSAIPKADMDLKNVAQDTTFYVGTSANTGQESGHITLLVTGEVDDPTAWVAIQYAKSAALVGKLSLPKGPVSQLYQNDFYSSRAKVIYHHGRVSQGHLRLQIVFSYPPQEWASKSSNR